MDNSLATHAPTQLATVATDQYLPPPGPWAQRIGLQVLVAIGVLFSAAAVLPFEQTVRSQGVVRPSGENSVVQSRLAGKVQRVLMRPNQQVRAGQVLAVLDQGSLVLRQRQARQELAQVEEQIRQTQQQQDQLQAEMSSNGLVGQALIASSRGDVAKARAALALAGEEMRRYRDLARQGAVPQLLSREKITGHLVAISEMRQAELSVAQQRARQLGSGPNCARRSVGCKAAWRDCSARPAPCGRSSPKPTEPWPMPRCGHRWPHRSSAPASSTPVRS